MSETEGKMLEAVKAGDTVKIHFTCKLEDGTVFDTSAGKDPLDFVVGEHQVMQGLEDAVLGMTKGASKSVIIPPEKAFGPHLKEKVHRVARDQFPRELEPMVGMKFEINQEDGSSTVVRVTEASESGVTLDTNHPLAGKDLLFDVEVVEIQPSKADCAAAEDFYKKGVDLQAKGQIDEAVSYYQKAIGQNPKHAGAYYNLGVAFQGKGLIDQAIIYYELAIGLKQDLTDAHHNLGVAFKDKGQFDDALICFQRVLQLKPDHAGAYYNVGNVLVAKGSFDEAMRFYQKAIEIEPNNADAHWNIALLNLLSGNLGEGWKGYEWRWKLKGVMKARQFSQPIWDGSDINGRTIFLYAEQGFGDTIQFIRYVPLVTRRGAKVIVECQKELTSLLRNVEGIEKVVPTGKTLPEFDLRYPLLSLPLIFNTTVQNIPAKVPYISADPAQVESWGDKIGSNNGSFKVGLVWSGDPGLKNDRTRSCPLDNFLPLAQSDNIIFYSLQKGEASAQAKDSPKGMNLIDYTAMINDFSDTAAFIQNLDLVISVDTSVAHLAGALGRPVWTLLPFVPDWRWMLNREDSPWYPTMKLFRQPAPGDWGSVIERLKDALDDVVRKRKVVIS